MAVRIIKFQAIKTDIQAAENRIYWWKKQSRVKSPDVWDWNRQTIVEADFWSEFSEGYFV